MSSSLENSKAIVVEYLDRFWAKGDVSVVSGSAWQLASVLILVRWTNCVMPTLPCNTR